MSGNLDWLLFLNIIYKYDCGLLAVLCLLPVISHLYSLPICRDVELSVYDVINSVIVKSLGEEMSVCSGEEGGRNVFVRAD